MVRRTKEEAINTRDRIIEAAGKAFYNRGVARTTLEDIAIIAGVTRGAVYWHFNNKADLVKIFLDQASGPLCDFSVGGEKDGQINPLGSLRKSLVDFFILVATDSETKRINEIILYKCELGDESGALRDRLRATNAERGMRIAETLQDAVNRGHLSSDLDVSRAAMLLQAYIIGVLRIWLLTPDSLSLHDEAARMVDVGLDMVLLVDDGRITYAAN